MVSGGMSIEVSGRDGIDEMVTAFGPNTRARDEFIASVFHCRRGANLFYSELAQYSVDWGQMHGRRAAATPYLLLTLVKPPSRHEQALAVT